MKFVVTGTFKMGNKVMDFEKSVETETADAAKEYVYSVIGSKHGTNRHKINIVKVAEVK